MINKYNLLQLNSNELIEYLRNNNYLYLDNHEILFQLVSTEEGKKFLIDNIDNILDRVDKLDDFVFILYHANLNNEDLTKKIAYNKSLKVRSAFMLTLSESNKYKLDYYYPNISDYLVNYDSNGEIIEIIDEYSLSSIAANILDYRYNKELFNELKEFLFKYYPKNHLLFKMYTIDPNNNTDDLFHIYEEIESDTKRLFESSIDFKIGFYLKYDDLLPDNLKIKMDKLTSLFPNSIDLIENIFVNELGDDFIKLLNKYYAISSSEVLSVGEIGTVCHTFNVGDFIIKYIKGSHSVYGFNCSCPSNFLINRVCDEVVSYDHQGNFLGKLQVQPRLSKPLLESELDILDKYSNELKKLGYFCDDLEPYHGSYNVYRLNSYQDADCEDCEELPDWFKENPYVLVDRDCVYSLDKEEEVNNIHNEILRRYYR
jgi:hypothetical protein